MKTDDSISREAALLEAWDEINLASLDCEAFKARLLTTWDAVNELVRATEARDDEIGAEATAETLVDAPRAEPTAPCSELAPSRGLPEAPRLDEWRPRITRRAMDPATTSVCAPMPSTPPRPCLRRPRSTSA